MKKKSKATKERILLAAAELFAQHGYHATTHQMMSDKAGVNIAAINYHFGSKEKLYLKVWDYLYDIAMEDYGDFINEDDATEDKLRGFIRWRVVAVTDTGLKGYLAQIVRGEMNKPSPIHDKLEKLYMQEKRTWFFSLISDILGHELDPSSIAMIAFCIYSPLIHLVEVMNIMEASLDREHREKVTEFWKDKENLADNIYTFAIAGLREVSIKA
ncbi:MAG: TetR/AcrR family transcriptional regulator [Kiritimatiellia bacterium]